MTDAEPCSFCAGTGQRPVPPPPRPPGRPPGGVGRTHGYLSTYNVGCRCDLCRAANREYARRRRERKKQAS